MLPTLFLLHQLSSFSAVPISEPLPEHETAEEREPRTEVVWIFTGAGAGIGAVAGAVATPVAFVAVLLAAQNASGCVAEECEAFGLMIYLGVIPAIVVGGAVGAGIGGAAGALTGAAIDYSAE